jgi:hypothetical protein
MLYVFGVLTIAVAVVLQAYLSWFMWSFRRINEAPAKEQIDLVTGYSQEFHFVPNYTAEYNVDFRLYMDISYEDMDRALEGQLFHVKYEIRRDAKNVGQGVISSGNISQVGHGRGVCSIQGKNPRILLKSGSQYRLLIKVQQGNQALGEFAPKIIVCTGVSLKGSSIPAIIRGRTVLWVFAAGLCLLGAAGRQHLSDRRKESNQLVQGTRDACP